MQKYGRFGKLRFYELDHESKMRLLKTHFHASNGLAMEPGTREEKRLKETQTLQQGKPPIKNLSRTAGVAGGGDRKRLYDKQTTEKALWQGKPLSKGRETQALVQGRIHVKNLSRNIGMAGVRRGNDKCPEWKATPPTAPQWMGVFCRNK